ncbi:dynein heavy chain 12, axonemal isoform X4 [Kryptolebias marmoratus]|uniref:dynein heavy chain 12, axonemal isoform X4 n=1 Tax=Kryptolebias marmoratus TaxID=37003 RepID=UPI0018AC8DF6|nr:dynein heavy chain 12, axonemal isoform X4 [Kryptolebias marmoratus]
MDAANVMDEDELLDPNVQMIIQDSCQRELLICRSETLKIIKAIEQGDLLGLQELCDFPSVFSQVDEHGWCPLHRAAIQPLVRVLEMVLYASFSLTLQEKTLEGETFLTLAVKAGLVENVKILLEHGASPQITNSRNESPLLLGADVNAQAPNGDSVLYDAAGAGNPDCINILLHHGANPNIPNLSSQLPIHRAAFEGHYLALRILIPITTRRALRLSGQSPVHSAADGGHAQCLELLLQKGSDANALLAPHMSENYGDMRKSPLYFAVSNGDATCTEILLKMGAKPDLDPLHCLLVAVRSGRYMIVKLLLAAEADVNCYFTVVNDTVFPTALQYCLNDEVMLRLLLNNGYDAERCFCCNHDNSCDDLFESGWSQHQGGKVAFCDFVSVSWLVNLVGRVVLILLQYVGQISLCGKLKKMLKKHKEWPQIHKMICNPQSLSHLSRVQIRKHLSYSTLKSMELPNRLRSYLLYKENDLYAKVICRED